MPKDKHISGDIVRRARWLGIEYKNENLKISGRFSQREMLVSEQVL